MSRPTGAHYLHPRQAATGVPPLPPPAGEGRGEGSVSPPSPTLDHTTAPHHNTPPHPITPSPTHTHPLYHTPLDYHDAATKALYLADKYRPILTGSVLDVGCGKRLVGDAVPRPDLYTGVDINPPCDVVVNLERDPLPFPDASFDVVTCCDVLEHLEAAHRVFDECCRVARSRVIIALPNPARDFIYNLYQNGAGKLKYYGFPGANPGNRHRWFFGFEEAERFVRDSAARNNWQVEQLDSAHDGGLYWLNGKGDDVLNHPNLTRGQLWAILKKA
ncbi:MAG: class I SAM-dependent methyltransferase [Phycisphaerales bacterium]|nr:class I SAM-dependent methyltransferase [Phycisphaerales bacterium]